MSSSSMLPPPSPIRPFSIIYVERAAWEVRETQEILARFPKAKQIIIESYKELINRRNQTWQLQKSAQKLVLAVRRDEFLYEAGPLTPFFEERHVYYNVLAINCLYNCEYCYLQGMYPSPHIVLFVNTQDFIRETTKFLDAHGSLYLALSYDTDLLSLNGISPITSQWLDFCHRDHRLKIEIRTKSTNISALRSAIPTDRAILAWTLSPQAIAEKYERGCPSTIARINAAKDLAARGWKIRICLDPILAVPDWEKLYGELIDTVGQSFSTHDLLDICIGTFRLPKRFHQKMKQQRPESALLHQEYSRIGDVIRYSANLKERIQDYASRSLERYYPQRQIQLMP